MLGEWSGLMEKAYDMYFGAYTCEKVERRVWNAWAATRKREFAVGVTVVVKGLCGWEKEEGILGTFESEKDLRRWWQAQNKF